MQDTEAVYEEVDLEDLEYDEVEEVHPVDRALPRAVLRAILCLLCSQTHTQCLLTRHVDGRADGRTGLRTSRSTRTRVLAGMNSESPTHNSWQASDWPAAQAARC